MAANTTDQASDSLEKIPENIAVNFLPECNSLSKKVLEKGLSYFTEGYIHEIRITEENGTVRVDAKCWRSMRKNQAAHKLHLEISDEKLLESYCTCKAGMSGHCSHIVGLIKSLQGFKLHNFTHVPDQQSCTSIPQQWHIPRGNKILPVPLNHVVVARPLEKRKRKPVLCHVKIKKDLPHLSKEDIRILKGIHGTPLKHIAEGIPKTQTPLGEIQIGSFLTYQTRNLKVPSEPMPDNGCGDTSVFQPSPILLPSEYSQLNIGYVTDVKKTELATRKQSSSKEWFEARKIRLTASNFGKVLYRKSAPSEKFLNNLFNIKEIRAASLEYGKRHENEAKARYLQLNKNRHFHECGFVINNDFAFLGATPDGKICDDGKTGIVEIKCPFVARNMQIASACESVKGFYLQKSNGQIRLKRDHEYYAQVQGQLMVTGCDFCEFIVFTQCDMHIERIQPDIPFMRDMLIKLAIFFKDSAGPYLANLNHIQNVVS